MIHPACQRLDYAFHFQLEKNGCHTADGKSCLDCDYVYLEIIGVIQKVHNRLFVAVEGGEELTLNARGLSLAEYGIVIPAHGMDEIFG